MTPIDAREAQTTPNPENWEDVDSFDGDNGEPDHDMPENPSFYPMSDFADCMNDAIANLAEARTLFSRDDEFSPKLDKWISEMRLLLSEHSEAIEIDRKRYSEDSSKWEAQNGY